MVKANKPEDYLGIRLWGKYLGSFEYYIKDQQNRAAAQGAPIDALYEREDKWTCVSDLHKGHDFIDLYNVYINLDRTSDRFKNMGSVYNG